MILKPRLVFLELGRTGPTTSDGIIKMPLSYIPLLQALVLSSNSTNYLCSLGVNDSLIFNSEWGHFLCELPINVPEMTVKCLWLSQMPTRGHPPVLDRLWYNHAVWGGTICGTTQLTREENAPTESCWDLTARFVSLQSLNP